MAALILIKASLSIKHTTLGYDVLTQNPFQKEVLYEILHQTAQVLLNNGGQTQLLTFDKTLSCFV